MPDQRRASRCPPAATAAQLHEHLQIPRSCIASRTVLPTYGPEHDNDVRASAQPLVLHLNGAPGVGQVDAGSAVGRASTPARCCWTSTCLRTWVSGWREGLRWHRRGHAAGSDGDARGVRRAESRRRVPAAPGRADELARFRGAAEAAGGRWVEVLIEAVDVEARFAARDIDEPHLEAVHQLVEQAGGGHVAAYAERLEHAGGTDGATHPADRLWTATWTRRTTALVREVGDRSVAFRPCPTRRPRRGGAGSGPPRRAGSSPWPPGSSWAGCRSSVAR